MHNTQLNEYLYKTEAKKFAFGKSDCVTFCGEWIKLCTGLDLIAPWRGRYWDLDSKEELVKQYGGFVQLVSGELDRYFARTDDPLTGDVGIVEVPTTFSGQERAQILAIRNGHFWTCHALFGIAGGALPYLHAWRIK